MAEGERSTITLSRTVVVAVWLSPMAMAAALWMGWPSAIVIATGLACATALTLLLGRPPAHLHLADGRDALPMRMPAERPFKSPGVAERQAAARTAAEVRATLDGVSDPVLATDVSALIVWCNSAAAEMVGREPSGVVGKHLDEVFSQGDVLRVHAAGSRGQGQAGRFRIARGDSARVFEVTARPTELASTDPANAGVRRVILTFRDVTELAVAAQLKTDFVANASHEIRTPLASIRGAVETLAESGDDPAMSARLRSMISVNVSRLEDLTRDLVELSRLESPEAPVEIGAVDVVEMLERARASFEPVCRERGLSISVEVPPGVSVISTDARSLELIFRNLIENSTKFAYEGTTIRVVGTATTTANSDGLRGARFEVIDRGAGIPLSQHGRIFERFYQGDSSRSGRAARRGTGLGLAIVKHAVKSLGGTVRVSSVWKEGTTMIVELPGCVGKERESGVRNRESGTESEGSAEK